MAKKAELTPELIEERKERQRQHVRAWQARNKEKVKEIQKRCYEKRREKNNAYAVAWRLKNLEHNRAYMRAYQAMLRQKRRDSAIGLAGGGKVIDLSLL